MELSKLELTEPFTLKR